MKNLCTICARSNSKGLRNKNIKNLINKPLIHYTIELAKKINFINNITISTDSNRIYDIVKKGLVDIGLRPKNLSNDYVSKIEVIRHATLKSEKVLNTKFDNIIDLDVTSPLRNKNDILNSFSKFKTKNANNLFTVCKAKKNPYFNMVEFNPKTSQVQVVKKNKKNFYSRQKAPMVYEMNASIYIWRRQTLFSKTPLFNKKTIIYEMPFFRSIDIDDQNDFEMVKWIMKKKFNK